MFDYTIESKFSIGETIEELEKSLKEEAFGVLWQFNVKDKLNEKGVDFDRDYCILEVCNPHEAKKVLTQNHMVGYFLPCKIVVYEHEGKTMVGMPKPTMFMGIVNDDALIPIAQDIEDRLIGCINKVKK